MSRNKGKSNIKSRDGESQNNQTEEINKKVFSPYEIISEPCCDELLRMTADEMEKKLDSQFTLNPTINLKDAATLDYYVGAAYWAKQQGFTPFQLGAFFTLAYQLLQKIKDEKCTMVELFKELHDQLIGIGGDVSDQRGHGMEFFTVAQGKAITEYLKLSLFQHYKLYKFMLTKPHLEEIMCTNISVEVPLSSETPFPPPLDEGLMENTYNEYFVIPATSSETQMYDEMKLSPPPEVILPADIEDIFAKLSPEDIKAIIQDMATDVLQKLQIGLETKIRSEENAVLTKINKLQQSLHTDKGHSVVSSPTRKNKM